MLDELGSWLGYLHDTVTSIIKVLIFAEIYKYLVSDSILNKIVYEKHTYIERKKYNKVISSIIYFEKWKKYFIGEER